MFSSLRKLIFIALVAGLCSSTIAFASIANDTTALSLGDRQQSQYNNLKKNTNSFIGSTHKAFFVPNFLYGKPLFKPKNMVDSYEQTIDNLFQRYPDLFQNITISDFRIEIEKPKNRNITQVHLFQKHKNTPVFGGEAIFTFNDKNELISYLGKYVPHLSIDTKPKTTPQEVKTIVTRDLKVDVITQEPRLFIFNKGVLTNIKENTQLVWRLGTNGWVYFVNANTKEIVYKYRDENNALSREVYTASGGTPTLPGTLVISEGDDTSTISDDDAVYAYNYSEDIYNYFYNNFALNSFDDAGTSMISTVDFDLTTFYSATVGGMWCNSEDPDHDTFLCPSTQQLIFEDGYAVLDVTAHEWTHAVDDYAVRDEDAGLYGLTYSDESGALNESYSDIFGVLVEVEYGDGLDWDIGEDLSSGVVRSLEDPTLYDQPDNLADECTATNDYCNYSADAGGIHTNSGIPNKAAYLIMREPSEGYETFNSIDVRGMGTDMAEQIFYYALRDELLVTATFEDNLNALLQTCYTLETIDIDTADCEPIYDAYTAIGVADGTVTFVEANMATDTTSGYGPLTVNFDGTASVSFGRNISTYVWDFGDGDTGSGDAVSHTYDPGSYTATLTITDSDGQTDSETINIEVTNPIETTFSQTGDGIAAPATVSFDASGTTDQTGTITDYAWNFGDGSTTSGTSATASHSYTSNSNYNVTLTVTDDTGYTDTSSHMVYVGTTGSTSISGTIYNDTWTAARSPYVISGSVTVASGYTLTIEPGTVIKFASTSSNLTVNGTLNAAGTSTDQIVFTSYKDDANGGDTNGDGSATTAAAGDWYYFKVADSATVTLDYVTMQYGGYTGTYYDYGMFWIDDNAASVAIDNSTLQYSQYYILKIDPGSASIIQNSTISNTAGRYGVYITGGTTTLTNNTISSTSSYGIYVSNSSPTIAGNTIVDFTYGIAIYGTSSTPIVTNNTFTGNTYPIYIYPLNSGTTLTGNTGGSNTYNVILLTGSTNGDFTLGMSNDLIYTFDQFGVTGGNTLTIEPGTIIKFKDSSSYFVVTGTLNAQGTSIDPIIFTSIKDDDYGGDTNEDSTTTTPAAGDWYYFKISDSATARLDYVTMQYGGYTGTSYDYSMFRIDDNAASVTVDHSTVQDSQYYTVQIDTGSTSIIANSTISNTSGQAAIYVTGGTTTLSNNTISSGGSQGIYVNNTSPTITGNTLTGCSYGIYVTGASSAPTITDNLIYDNTSYGLYNTSTTTITAESNWWGDASGPYHVTSNPTGTGDTVGSYVDFDPWTTTDPAADVTPPSDVTLGTIRKDVWTPSVTLNWTNPTDIDFDHVQVDRTIVTSGITTTVSSTETGTSYVDTTASYNMNYTYTLYACDTTGNCSTGVTTASQRVRNPMPTGLTLTAGNTSIASTWTASSAPATTLGGYKIYYGTSATALTSVIDVGNVTSTTLTGLANGTRYYVAVAAYSRSGIESSQSAIQVTRPHP